MTRQVQTPSAKLTYTLSLLNDIQRTWYNAAVVHANTARVNEKRVLAAIASTYYGDPDQELRYSLEDLEQADRGLSNAAINLRDKRVLAADGANANTLVMAAGAVQ
ncbi:MAG: hypothetical protein AAGF24_00125 [Cyanobacteria bacterium P01_H01_bin.121]